MRIWDIAPERLCRAHLLGEHRELHAIWSVITRRKKGYAHHPETMRWRGKLRALYRRHEQLVAEMINRGYFHRSPLDARAATGAARQDRYIDTPPEQLLILQKKGCDCRTSPG
ncbi:MAG: pyrimidine dimer DNA glycosylase/endonuclease V [Candidatus Omnitrophota bacterium]